MAGLVKHLGYGTTDKNRVCGRGTGEDHSKMATRFQSEARGFLATAIGRCIVT